MAPQSFWRFIVWRMCCTTVFFIALLIAVFTATSVYYVVRINMIEKQINAKNDPHSGKKAAAAAAGKTGGTAATEIAPHNGVAVHEDSEDIVVNFYRFMSRATPAGHSEFRKRPRTSTATMPYAASYKILEVNRPLSRQAVRNPTLPESFPLWENVFEGHGDDEGVTAKITLGGNGDVAAGATARVPVPARQRYVLHGLTAGKHYMLRLSYLGSPSVNFEMRLYQVRRVHLELQQLQELQQQYGQQIAGWSAAPHDTELRVFAVSTMNALRFDYEEEVWVDAADAQRDEDEGEESDELAGEEAEDDESTASRYVPVVEVIPRTLSIPIDVARVPAIRFNIALEPLSASFLPQVAMPFITYTAFVVVFVGYLFIYTFVSTGIAGGRPHED